MKRALIVEDQADARRWMRSAVADAFPGCEISEAGSLAQVAARLETFVPDLCIVDLGLPDGSGVDVIRRLNAGFPECVSVVTTIFADDEHLFPALGAGAQGYLLKDDGGAHLVRALRGIVAGEPPLSPAIARRLLRTFGPPATDPATSAPQAGALTERERDVLILAAKGLTLQAIADGLEISRNTASWHLKNVYRKLDVSTRAEAAIAALDRGLIVQGIVD